VKIITGNDLKSGAVIWWTGQDWSIHVEDAADVGDNGEQILAVEDAACRVNGGYVIDAEREPERAGRAMDHDSEDAFERLRVAGYM